jgi:glucose-1-phosphate thymidylyltransferase
MPASSHNPRPVIGLLPAAGQGRRVSPLPCSKEVLPVGVQALDGHAGPRVRVISQFLLEAYRRAGVARAYWLLRDGKWDIPAYWADGAAVGIDLGYLLASQWQYGPPFTLDQAYPFVRDATVVVGFPDLFFTPLDAFEQLVDALRTTESDVMLGVFPTDAPETADVVAMAPDGRIEALHVKPHGETLATAWIIAAWQPRFTEWMHARAQSLLAAEGDGPLAREQHLGHFIRAALADGLDVRGTTFPDGAFLDVGTPDALRHVLQASSLEQALHHRPPHPARPAP